MLIPTLRECNIMALDDVVEIVFHGRGGQGSVTAANLLVAAALKDGNKGLQAFPVFGAERRGAPVRAFARISETEIHLRSEIYEPDIVIVQDESIMNLVNVLKGMKKEGRILINTQKSPDEFDFEESKNIATVDATGIAIKYDIVVGGIPVVNTPILWAVPKVLEKVTLPSIQQAIREKWKGDAGEKNVKATADAFDMVEVTF